MILDDLRSRMAQLYAATAPPAWLDPHDDHEPTEEEYSQVTDGDRHVIVQSRAVAWLQACSELLDAQLEPELPAELPVRDEQRWVLTSAREGTLPIHVRMFSDEHPVVGLGVDREYELRKAPWHGCGCDRCDSGSEPELEMVDAFFERVLQGHLVQLAGPEYYADLKMDTGSGTAGGSSPLPLESGQAMSVMWAISRGEAVELPPGLVAFHGCSWL